MAESIYIATATANAPAARRLAEELRAEGHLVVSTWHDRPGVETEREREAAMPYEDRLDIAHRCLDELVAADLVVVLSHPAMRGALVEMGIALGQDIAVEWRGDEGVTLFSTLAEARS